MRNWREAEAPKKPPQEKKGNRKTRRQTRREKEAEKRRTCGREGRRFDVVRATEKQWKRRGEQKTVEKRGGNEIRVRRQASQRETERRSRQEMRLSRDGACRREGQGPRREGKRGTASRGLKTLELSTEKRAKTGRGCRPKHFHSSLSPTSSRSPDADPERLFPARAAALDGRGERGAASIKFSANRRREREEGRKRRREREKNKEKKRREEENMKSEAEATNGQENARKTTREKRRGT